MSEMAQSGTGVQVVCGSTLIGEVVDMKLPSRTVNEADSTSHDNLEGVESSIPTTITQGDGTVKINYYGSTVQDALWTDMTARTIREWMFIMPMAFAGGGRSYTFNGYIKSINMTTPMKGPVQWDITVKAISSTVPKTTGAAGLTTPFMAFIDNDANAITPTETPAQTTYEYNLECYSDDTYLILTPTAAVGTIYVNGTVCVSGAASGHITTPTATGGVIYIVVMVAEAGKTPKVYRIRVQKGLTVHP